MPLTPFDLETAQREAVSNYVWSIYGAAKTGKTTLALSGRRPLHEVHLDTNPGIMEALVASAQKHGSDGLTYNIIRPVQYSALTQEEAQRRVASVEADAHAFIAAAEERFAKGESGGTFVLDGGTILKGYYEKAILGESATLGYRAARGERGGPSTFDYAKSNAALFDFIAMFNGAKCDLVLVFEGRRVYKEVFEDGRKVSKATDKYKSTRPDRLPFAISAEVETLKVMTSTDPSNNQAPTIVTPSVRIAYSGSTISFDNVVLPVDAFGGTIEGLKKLLMGDTIPEDVFNQMQSGNLVVRANDAGLLSGPEDD